MTDDASQLINLKLKPAGYVTYGDNNRGRILRVGDIGGDDKVIIKDVLLVDGLLVIHFMVMHIEHIIKELC